MTHFTVKFQHPGPQTGSRRPDRHLRARNPHRSRRVCKPSPAKSVPGPHTGHQ